MTLLYNNGAQLVVIGRLDGVVPGRWHVALMSQGPDEGFGDNMTREKEEERGNNNSKLMTRGQRGRAGEKRKRETRDSPAHTPFFFFAKENL